MTSVDDIEMMRQQLVQAQAGIGRAMDKIAAQRVVILDLQAQLDAKVGDTTTATTVCAETAQKVTALDVLLQEV